MVYSVVHRQTDGAIDEVGSDEPVASDGEIREVEEDSAEDDHRSEGRSRGEGAPDHDGDHDDIRADRNPAAFQMGP
jgi:hypothetical protein